MQKIALLAVISALGAVTAACDRPAPVTAQTETGQAEAAGASAPAPSNVASITALPRTPSPAAASVAILSPRNGDVVSSPVRVVFDIQGMTLAPAGDTTPDSGHHHLLIDATSPAPDRPLPTDESHLHFGKGQTEAEVALSPGEHSLMLVLGDANHVPHDPPVVSVPVTITVQ